MTRLSRDALLGASDLIEREVDLPSIDGSVLVRSLPAAYSNQAMSDALEVTTHVGIGGRQEQTAHVNTAKLEALQVLHGMIDPKLGSIEDAYVFAQQCGPAWRKVVEAIDEISGIRKEDIEKANAIFRPDGTGEEQPAVANGSSAGSGRPDVPARTGA